METDGKSTDEYDDHKRITTWESLKITENHMKRFRNKSKQQIPKGAGLQRPPPWGVAEDGALLFLFFA